MMIFYSLALNAKKYFWKSGFSEKSLSCFWGFFGLFFMFFLVPRLTYEFKKADLFTLFSVFGIIFAY